jgi:hypothetical protein
MGSNSGPFLTEVLGSVKANNLLTSWRTISYSKEDHVPSDCLWCYGNVS